MRPVAILLLAALAACSVPPRETPEEARARRGAECSALGFKTDTPEQRLCLLLQQTNERLDDLDRRISRLDRYYGPTAYPYYYRPYWW